jgi:hypothetical protein
MALGRARRQIQVFDIAIVAVVTKVLGAFIVLVVILLPYYKSDLSNKGAVDVLRDRLRDARSTIERAEKALDSDPGAVAGLIDRAGTSITGAEAYLEALRDKLDHAKAHIDRLEEREKKRELEPAEEELSKAREEISRLREERDRLEEANKSLRAESAEMKTADASLRREDEALRKENEELRRRNSEAERTATAGAEARSRNESLERENSDLRRQAEAARHQNEDLTAEVKSLRERAKAEDPGVVMRWFSVGLAIAECPDVDFALYVRWEGALRNAHTGSEMPIARMFSASRSDERTLLLGHRYYDLGARSDTGNLGDKALQREAFPALAKGQMQLKFFNAVSRADGYYSAYVAVRDPAALRARQCALVPYYLSWAGATLGQRIVLSQTRPFAWLRRFRINKDGTNTLALSPRDDEEFLSELDEFSRTQSEDLCRSRGICRTEDAHRVALQALLRAPRPAP